MRLREEVMDGKYALVLGFDSKLPFTEWEVRLWCARARRPRSRAQPGAPPRSAAAQTRASKFESFFGPGVRAVLVATSEGVDVALVSDGTVAGGLTSNEEVLPPLMPGLAPRVVKKKE